MNLRYLKCPNCSELYEVSEKVFDSFNKFQCANCQNSGPRENFEVKGFNPEFDKNSQDSNNLKLENNNTKTNMSNTNDLEQPRVPLEKVNLDMTTEGNSSSEIIKNLAIMIAVLALLGGFVFLMIKK